MHKMKDTDLQRQIFVEKYSIEIEFPAYYYVDSKFVPHHDNLILVMAYHIIPKEHDHTVQTTFIDGSVNTGTFDDLYAYAKDKSLILKL